jgi:hypothetical protein
MAISKPSWLRTWLEKLNWDILTWKVYVGDAIESGIDWAIGWINWGIYQAEQASNKAVAAWDKAVEVGRNAWNDLMKEVAPIWAQIDIWWSDLGEWWEGKKQDIREWIDAAEEVVGEWWDSLKQDFDKLHLAWDNFWTTTWPQLLKDFNTLLVNVGNFFTQTLPKLAAQLDITKALDNFRLEWKDLFNFWGDRGKEVSAFFADPGEWLLDKIEKMLERFW